MTFRAQSAWPVLALALVLATVGLDATSLAQTSSQSEQGNGMMGMM